MVTGTFLYIFDFPFHIWNNNPNWLIHQPATSPEKRIRKMWPIGFVAPLRASAPVTRRFGSLWMATSSHDVPPLWRTMWKSQGGFSMIPSGHFQTWWYSIAMLNNQKVHHTYIGIPIIFSKQIQLDSTTHSQLAWYFHTSFFFPELDHPT